MTTSNYALRLPESLKRQVEKISTDDGTTINQFIVSAVAEKVSALKTAEYFVQRAARADLSKFDKLMTRKGGEPPTAGDEALRDGRLSYQPASGLTSEQMSLELADVELCFTDKSIIAALKPLYEESVRNKRIMEVQLSDFRKLIGAPAAIGVSFSRGGVRFGIVGRRKGFHL